MYVIDLLKKINPVNVVEILTFTHIFIYNKCVILCRLGVCVWTQKKPLRRFWKRLRTERLLPNR